MLVLKLVVYTPCGRRDRTGGAEISRALFAIDVSKTANRRTGVCVYLLVGFSSRVSLFSLIALPTIPGYYRGSALEPKIPAFPIRKDIPGYLCLYVAKQHVQ